MAAPLPVDERTQLLNNVRETFFVNPPANLLYLGAGADVSNPYGCTHTAAMTFVDSEAFAIDSLEAHIKAVFGDTTQIARTVTNNVVTRLTATNATGQVVQTIDLKKMGYETYFEQNNAQFACIFDKDSWLDDASANVVCQFVRRLQANGYWISNSSNLASPLLADLLTAVGATRVTAQLDEVIRLVSFGYSTVQVFRRTNAFSGPLFDIVYSFAKALKPLFVMVDDRQKLEADQVDDFDDIIDGQVAAAETAGEAVANYATIQQLLTDAATQLKADIRTLV